MRVQLDVVQGRGAPEVLDLDATSLEDARREAAQRGYTVLAARGATALQRRGHTRFDVPVFIEQLRDLLIAGLSVIEALSTLQAGARGAGVVVIHSLASELRGGRRLSEALALQPVFPPLLVALVRASELTSDLPQALGRYIEHEQRVAEVRHRIVSVAIYPALVTAVGALVLLFLALYVMPRFARVFDGMTGELPWSARAMVAWAHWLHGHQLILLTAVGLALAVLVALLSAPAVRDHALRRLLDTALLSVDQTAHDKTPLVDRETVELGSYNFSDAAAHKNSENVLVNWHNQRLAAVYLEHFERNYRQAVPFELRY